MAAAPSATLRPRGARAAREISPTGAAWSANSNPPSSIRAGFRYMHVHQPVRAHRGARRRESSRTRCWRWGAWRPGGAQRDSRALRVPPSAVLCCVVLFCFRPAAGREENHMHSLGMRPGGETLASASDACQHQHRPAMAEQTGHKPNRPDRPLAETECHRHTRGHDRPATAEMRTRICDTFSVPWQRHTQCDASLPR
jgi:hypothetical protein